MYIKNVSKTVTVKNNATNTSIDDAYKIVVTADTTCDVPHANKNKNNSDPKTSLQSYTSN